MKFLIFSEKIDFSKLNLKIELHESLNGSCKVLGCNAGPSVPLCRFKICKQNHARINPLTCSALRVTPYILQKMVKKGHGRPRKSLFSKILKIIIKRTTDVMVPKSQKYPSKSKIFAYGHTDVWTYE